MSIQYLLIDDNKETKIYNRDIFDNKFIFLESEDKPSFLGNSNIAEVITYVTDDGTSYLIIKSRVYNSLSIEEKNEIIKKSGCKPYMG
ncbi:hypothetical protein LG195_12640 [Proteus terrae]|uniref:hypothetical protein n=1 Tax=Proteus terrae TaxID=1574161 RepID=UPI00207CCAD8|nr:hypothetical protein [Proteus terrae]MCO4179770.1 hypothetical protein [Proteus terrae]MCO4189878.1 hypothetical protein [Proteus terrae]